MRVPFLALALVLAGCVGGYSGPTEVSLRVVNKTADPWIVDVQVTDPDGVEILDRAYTFTGAGERVEPENFTVQGAAVNVEANAHYEVRSGGTQTTKSLISEARHEFSTVGAAIRITVEADRVVISFTAG